MFLKSDKYHLGGSLNSDDRPNLFKLDIGILVIDEIHEYRNMGSQCLGLIKLSRAARHVIGLSGTPIYNSSQVGYSAVRGR